MTVPLAAEAMLLLLNFFLGGPLRMGLLLQRVIVDAVVPHHVDAVLPAGVDKVPHGIGTVLEGGVDVSHLSGVVAIAHVGLEIDHR